MHERGRAFAVAIGVLALLAVTAEPATAVTAVTAQLRYRFADSRIDEASGIAVGVRSPGVDYVQNDSGDSARFFALDAATGRTAATIIVPGATNVDWEDLAVAPAPAGSSGPGRSSVWLADIGDNDAVRSEVRVYRVDEPHIVPGAHERTVRVARPDVWRLRYPGGPVNAESLAVTPGGVGYVVTKSPFGSSTVYRLPPRPDPDRVQTLVRIGALTVHPSGTPGPFGVLGTLAVTGAALSRDGSLLTVRTYTDAYVWPVRDDDVAAALRQPPVRVPLPFQPQGEGIALDGSRVIIDSEGVHAAVYTVPLRSVPLRSVPAPAPAPSVSAPAALPTHPASPSTAVGWLLAGGFGCALLAAAAVVLRRRRAR